MAVETAEAQIRNKDCRDSDLATMVGRRRRDKGDKGDERESQVGSKSLPAPNAAPRPATGLPGTAHSHPDMSTWADPDGVVFNTKIFVRLVH